MRDENKGYVKSTIQYYDRNAKDFIGSTITVDFTTTQSYFTSKLKNGSHILDFGCGSGRDTKYFLEQGYQVTAIDGSAELCKLASEYVGIQVKHKMFQELDEEEVYDGVWACSSILHLPFAELKDVFCRIRAALKKSGVFYTSFKYGNFEGERNGRYFTDMTEDRFSVFLKDVGGLKLEEEWVTSDVRPGRGDEKWLNIILRKQ